MKKLMVIAAAASLAAVAEAGIVVNTNCHPRSVTCPVVAYKVTASGKIAAPVEKKDDVYKSTSKLSIKKGALVLFPVDNGTDDCCYETYSLYLQVKINKETYPVGVFYETIDSWSIFGKDYNKSLEAEKSKKFKVESELGLSYAANNSGNGSGIASGGGNGDTVTDSASLGLIGPLDDFAFIATAFGKGTYAYTFKESKSACSACTVTENYVFTPGNYSGWFAGLVSDFGGDYGCLLCNCNDLDVFGGTWKAKYDKSWSKTSAGWEKAASYVFGAGVLADMKDAEIE